MPFQNISSFTKTLKQKYSFLLKPFCCLIIIYTISFLAIIRADYNYIDDMGRRLYGYQGWDNFSRYISVYLSSLLHADQYLTDISPLPQLAAVCLLALSSVIMIFVMSDQKKITFWEIIAVLPLGISPYFMQCISYKYDAPYMALSIFASVLPFMLSQCQGTAYFITSVAGILVMCCTYQAASGIYPMLTAYLCFRWWNQGGSIKKIFGFLLRSVTAYAAAFLIYRMFLMRPIEGYDYVSASLAPIGQIIPQLIKYFKHVYHDFKRWWSVLAFLLAVFFVWISVINTCLKKYAALLGAIVTVMICTILSFGMYPALSEPLYSPRAMYGFGVLLAILGVAAVGNKHSLLPKMICFCFSYSFFAFGFTYGNALAEQDRYTQLRMQAVIYDLNDLDILCSDQMKTIQLAGDIGKSPVIKHMPQNYQILNRLVPNTFGDSWYWSKYYFYHYFEWKNVKQDASVDLTKWELPVLKNTMYHTIRGNEEFVLIELK